MTGQEFYCPLAWGSVALRNNGDYRLCCHANVSEAGGILRSEDGNPINISNTQIAEAQNHHLLRDVRKKFMSGEWPSACVRCKTEEEAGIKSGRTHALQRAKNEGLEEEFQLRIQNTKPDGTVSGNLPVVEMDVRFGNYCNLRCRSCGPTDSASWYKDWVRMGNSKFLDSGISIELQETEAGVSALPNRFQWVEELPVAKMLPTDTSRLNRIYLAGGEPLLIPKHLEFLEHLVQVGAAKNIYLEYNSNLTILPKAVLELWTHFRSVGVGISVDGIGKYHEYLRFPAKQKILEQNLSVLDVQPNNVRAWFACTVSWMNLGHLPDFLFWIEQKKFQKVGIRKGKMPVSFHLLHKPAHLNLQSIPLEAKKYLEQELWAQWEKVVGEISKPTRLLAEEFFQKVIRFMHSKEGAFDWQDLLKKNQRLDEIRGQDFTSIHPELAKILGYKLEERKNDSIVSIT